MPRNANQQWSDATLPLSPAGKRTSALRRWAIRSILASLLVGLIIWLLLPTVAWDGAVARQVRIQVYDSAGQPLNGIEIVGGQQVLAVTDRHGMATWTHLFPAGGGFLFGIKTGRWRIGGGLQLRSAAGDSYDVSFATLVHDPHRSVWNHEPVIAKVTFPQLSRKPLPRLDAGMNAQP